MALLSTILGGSEAASIVKGVQRGAAAMGNTNSFTVTISPVDTAKAWLVFSARMNANYPDADQRHWLLDGQVSDATTLTFTRQRTQNSADAFVIEWQVMEFN